MAFAAGKGAVVSLNGNVITSYFNKAGLKRIKAAIDTTVMGVASKTSVEGLRDSSFTLGGLLSTTKTEIDAFLDTAFSSSAAIALVYTPVAGGAVYTISMHVTDYAIDTDVSGAVVWSATLQGTGDVSRA